MITCNAWEISHEGIVNPTDVWRHHFNRSVGRDAVDDANEVVADVWSRRRLGRREVITKWSEAIRVQAGVCVHL